MARRGDRWEAHPVLAWWVRVGVLLVPLGVSLLVALAVIAVLPTPATTADRVGWWVVVLGLAYGSALLVEQLARRALPLAVLLRLSLVFPDRAPSRLRTARRTSLREIERQLQATDEPSTAAHVLVSLVGALGLHDRRTRGHSERVRAYVDVLSQELGLPEEDRVRLRWAALLHDVGKLSVPGAVLNAGRDLGDDEWAALRQHPVEGERLAGALLPWLGPWGRCVREHHERWDGSGYPQGLSGTEISYGARIVAVADAFEVMTANRSYQQAIKATAAREELARCAGTDFDPAVVRAFLQVSIGRLRGVLGPLAFLPALPVAALADRAGRALQGVTTVAAVSAVALATPSGVVVRTLPSTSAAPAVVLGTPAPVAVPVATPAPTPVPTRARPARRTAPRPAAAPVVPRARVAAPAATPAPPPAAAPLPGTLYLADGALVGSPPAGGSLTLAPGSPRAFGVTSPTSLRLRGTAQVVLLHQLRTRHGNGQPSASVSLALLDCGPSGCRRLAGTTVALTRSRSGYAGQTVSLGPLDTVLPAGHALQLQIALVARGNVTGLVVAYGGSTPTRLVLP